MALKESPYKAKKETLFQLMKKTSGGRASRFAKRTVNVKETSRVRGGVDVEKSEKESAANEKENYTPPRHV